MIIHILIFIQSVMKYVTITSTYWSWWVFMNSHVRTNIYKCLTWDWLCSNTRLTLFTMLSEIDSATKVGHETLSADINRQILWNQMQSFFDTIISFILRKCQSETTSLFWIMEVLHSSCRSIVQEFKEQYL